MLARLLNLHGVYLPLEKGKESGTHKSKYWESVRIQLLNDELLRLGDSVWFDSRAFQVHSQHPDKIENLRQKCRSLIAEISGQAPGVIAIKDPRICRLVPFWKSLLTEENYKISAIVPFRNPLEVAASITSRDGFNTHYCLSLWLRHILEAEYSTRDMNRIFVSFSNLITSWPSVFSRMQSQLQLKGLRAVSEVESEIFDFIEAPLKHWSFSKTDLRAYVGSDGLPFRAFRLLERAEQGAEEDVRAEFDELREELNRSSTIKEEMDCRNKKISAFQHKVSRAFDTRQLALEESGKKLSIAKQLLADSEFEQSQLQQEIEILLARLETKDEKMENLSQQILDQSSQLHQIRRDLANHVEKNESLRNTLSWKITAPLRFLFDWLVLYPLRYFKK